ncbi:MAG: hypothetical protein QXF12_00805 [Candidatus Aenigmatarchaeota archaeon]
MFIKKHRAGFRTTFYVYSMKTATKKVMEHKMKDLMIEGNNMVQNIETLDESLGRVYHFIVNRAFVLDRNKTGGIDLYHDLKETDVHEVLIEHYSHVFDLINNVMRDSNFDFTEYDKVSFKIIVNMNKSSHYYKELIVYSEDDDEYRFYADISKRVFYDLVIEGIEEYDDEICKDEISRLVGIPHFAVPALIKFLEKWLQLTEEPVAVA